MMKPPAGTPRDLRSVLEPQNIRFVYPHEASVHVPLDSLAALDLGDRVRLDAESLESLEAASLKHHRHDLAGRVLGIDHRPAACWLGSGRMRCLRTSQWCPMTSGVRTTSPR